MKGEDVLLTVASVAVVVVTVVLAALAIWGPADRHVERPGVVTVKIEGPTCSASYEGVDIECTIGGPR